MDRRSFITGLAFTAIAGIVATEAQAATWVSLGQRKVNWLVDFDQINVGLSEGIFDKLRLKVTGNDLFLLDLKVRYGNGDDDDIPVRLVIPQGGQTRVIDLQANNRFIRHVRFTYSKPFDGDGATWVELLGRR